MRSRFDRRLDILNKKMIEMGAECETAIAQSVKALLDGDMKIAAMVKQSTRRIDELEREIEGICLKLLLQQQPVAKDLRNISAALKMITDMDRIGVQSEEIAEIVTALDGKTGKESADIRQMALDVIKMVSESVDAYVRADITLADGVIKYDDVVDDAFLKVKQNLIALIGQNARDGEYALDLLMIAKYFERIGDHAVNIAEWVKFSVTGVHRGE